MRSISGLLFIGSRVRFVGNQTYIGVTLRSLDELAQEPGMSNPTLNGRISNTILLVVAPFFLLVQQRLHDQTPHRLADKVEEADIMVPLHRY